MTINEYLKHHKLITDGSFGTYYSEKYQTDDMPENANTSFPERVLEIHSSYIEAGAKLIRTNTFASNTSLLSSDWTTVEKNILAAIKIAKTAIGDKEVFIAGDIGPIPESTPRNSDTDQLSEEYYQIARCFVENGISVLTFETFPDTEHILSAIQRIKKEYPIFIMVQFCVDQFGYSTSGLSAKKLLETVKAMPEIDAIGLNCGVGPGHMAQIYKKVNLNSDKYLISLPNAGYPKRIQSRQLIFDNNCGYFADKLADLSAFGMDILGGCCGTNPAFIKVLSDVLDIEQPTKTTVNLQKAKIETPRKNTGFIYNKDGSLKNKKLIAVELAPPISSNDEKLLEAAHFLQNEDVDVLTFPDSPSGRTRVDSVLMAEKVRRATGMCVMPHICCRDKNAIAMRSLFLGAYINDIHNFLIVTGDPIPSLARQNIKSVFNFDSVGLMQIAKDMNEETFTDMPIAYGGAINQGRRNIDVEIKRIKKKMDTGASFS